MLTEGLLPSANKNKNSSSMLTKILMPIPEETYTRIIYFGKLVVRHKNLERNKKSPPTLEEMMREIWEEASIFNSANFISGHLAYTKSLHVVHLLEGKEKIVNLLMERFYKDPRVIITEVIKRESTTKYVGWQLSTCYLFEITSTERQLIKNKEVSLENMIDMMLSLEEKIDMTKNTYQAKGENLDVPSFYKHIIECISLKYIFITYKRTVLDNKTAI
jgi:hypothetical protein